MSTWNTPKRKHVPVEGRYRWFATGILSTETILCWKYRKDTGHLDEEAALNTPFYIWFPWTISLVLMCGWWLYLRFKSDATVKYIEGDYNSDSDEAPSESQ